jgi:hypothetical protein
MIFFTLEIQFVRGVCSRASKHPRERDRHSLVSSLDQVVMVRVVLGDTTLSVRLQA